MSDQWRIDNVARGGFYALVRPDGRCVGTLSDAESAVRVLRALNHLEALEEAAREREARLRAALRSIARMNDDMLARGTPDTAERVRAYLQIVTATCRVALAEQPAPGATTTEGE